MLKALLAALRTSEFWLVLGQIVLQVFQAPVPDEFKTVAWLYIAFRIVSKIAQYVFPNPQSPTGGFFKNDTP